MRGARRLASLLAQRAATGPSLQPGALKQLQRSFATGPFTGSRGAGAAAAARAPWLVVVAAGLSAGLGAQLVSGSGGEPAECKAAEKPKAAIKEYDKEEVAKHRSKETGIWVTYKDGVYDVTQFIDAHPGGAQRLMMAAGGAIDPFWAMYQQHNTDQVKGMLEEYRIGRLKGGAGAGAVADPYANEPPRLPALIVRTQKPMNSETPKEFLVASLVTPNELFYVRNHLPVPHPDPATYRLKVEGEGLRAMELSLDELKTKFKRHSVTATVQCTGNRRNEFNETQRKVKGLEWDGGSISTAVFTGVRLRDVLRAAGLEEEDPVVQHIQFEGLDQDMEGQAYGASIEVEKAMDPHGDVLLAFEMNGQPMPADHGFPLRVLVPGVAGCRSVKWLGKIIASAEESRSFWQQRDYKSFGPNVDWDNVDWDSAPAIQAMPITSQICEPQQGAVVEDDEVTVKGYAWSGGGQGIIRVDVSADGGTTWHTAELQKVPQKRGRGWAWALWQATIPLPKDFQGDVQLVCKATDESYNTQPESAAPIWNLRGVNCNSWHRVGITVQQ